ncbi:MAG: hypothetical protein KBS68_02515 [Clostridiales bacterium]|nr:hypothetical protein [Candidatus Crickella merdequi]
MSELFEYKCPNCGMPLSYTTNKDVLYCKYCHSEVSIDAMNDQESELGTKEDDFKWEDIASETWDPSEIENLKVYVCESCGGEIVAEESTAATKCPYCDSPVVMKGNFEGALKPDVVIPFKIDKETAKEAYFKHLSGKKFLPKVFKDQNHIDEMKAMYVPFWLFECDADASIRYDATRVSSWSDSQNNYVKTDHYRVIREGSIGFDNVPIDGSIAMPDDLIQSVEPYDYSEAVPFKTAYLAGYLADKYTLGIDDAIPQANSRVSTSVATAFRSTVQGYASVTPVESHVSLKKGKTKYAMYPVWVLNTTFQGEHFVFSINGQTGKTAGDLPLDKGAFWRYFLSRTAIGTAILFACEAVLLLM